MDKYNEIKDPNSCLNRADPFEMLFVLLARDDAAPDTIRFWIKKRIEIGKNKEGDKQLTDAEECARAMERENATGV